MDQRRDHMKTNFEYFQIQKWILQSLRSEKIDQKNGVICLVSMFPSRFMVLKLSKKMHFWNFLLTSVRNLSLLKQFTYMHLKGLVMHFQKMVLFIMLIYCFGYISVWIRRIFSNSCWFSIFFDISIANVSWVVAPTP